jgi:hypothetical protein
MGHEGPTAFRRLYYVSSMVGARNELWSKSLENKDPIALGGSGVVERLMPQGSGSKNEGSARA